MRINTSAFSRNTNSAILKGMNIQKFNQKASENSKPIIDPKSGKDKDRLNLSPFKTKASNLLESLMEQKQNIMEQKNNFINSNIERGVDLNKVKSQIELFDEQLKNIDKQINDYMLEQSKPKEEKEEKKSVVNKEQTEEELNAERLNNITNKADSLTKAKIVNKTKNQIGQEKKVLLSEQKIDSSRGHSSSSRQARIDKIDVTLKDLESNSIKDTNKINKEINKETEELNTSVVTEE